MNRAFDYNGTIVAPSHPVRKLKTVKKVLSIDSADRDVSKFPTNGDFVVYLPRVYENIVSVRLMSGEFPPLVSEGGGNIVLHSYGNGPNAPSTDFSNDSGEITPTPYYFLIDLEGLNKTDEAAIGANKSTYTDGFFAKVPALTTSGGFIEYNDHSGNENSARYSPPLGKLDRLRIRTRLHSQQGNQGFMYWTTDGSQYSSGETTIVNYTLLLEVEYMDNTFDDFSSFETRINERDA
jgi:hypothetical protein